jgi:hypothetical protein
MSPWAILLALIFFPIASSAYDSRLGIDPQIHLDQLSRTGKIEVRTARHGGSFKSDASAVLQAVDFNRLWAASLAYDRYAEMGMPGLQQSRLVQTTPSHLYIWSHMTAMGQTSRHYLEVRKSLGLPRDARATEWQLVHPPASRLFSFPDEPSFSTMDGSWYIERLSAGTRPGSDRVYVRYFLSADPTVRLPDILIGGIARDKFSQGVAQVIRALAREAAVRQ